MSRGILQPLVEKIHDLIGIIGGKDDMQIATNFQGKINLRFADKGSLLNHDFQNVALSQTVSGIASPGISII
jgi:hypothetical protein